MSTVDRIDNPVVIMAGGAGIRLRPLTNTIPKPLLQVDGMPILEHLILNLKKQGFWRFFIATHYLGQMIEDYFQDGSLWEVQIKYLKEKAPLGTAGAISLLNSFELFSSNQLPFFVINGDSLINADYRALINQFPTEVVAQLGTKTYFYTVPYGCVLHQENTVLNIEEKPTKQTLISVGVYLFSPSVLNHIPKNTYLEMPDLLNSLIQKQLKITHFNIEEDWIDLGQLQNHKDLENPNKTINNLPHATHSQESCV